MSFNIFIMEKESSEKASLNKRFAEQMQASTTPTEAGSQRASDIAQEVRSDLERTQRPVKFDAGLMKKFTAASTPSPKPTVSEKPAQPVDKTTTSTNEESSDLPAVKPGQVNHNATTITAIPKKKVETASNRPAKELIEVIKALDIKKRIDYVEAIGSETPSEEQWTVFCGKLNQKSADMGYGVFGMDFTGLAQTVN